VVTDFNGVVTSTSLKRLKNQYVKQSLGWWCETTLIAFFAVGLNASANMGDGSGSSNLVSFLMLKLIGLLVHFSSTLFRRKDSILLLWDVLGVQHMS
jgi:hypothetical protein